MKHLFVSVPVRTAFGCAALGLLSACGGGSYQPSSYTPPPVMQGDTFTAAVQSSIATVPEDVEAASIDAIVATEVDNKEPEAVM